MINMIPAGVWAGLFILFSIGLTQTALSIFNLWYKRKGLPYHNEISGIVFGALSLLYSLLIAFVIVAVWEDYEELNRTVESETDKLNSVVVHSGGLPAAYKLSINDTVLDYCEHVVNNDWNASDADVIYRASAIPKLREMLLTVIPESASQERIFDVLDENLSTISDLRRERLSHLHSHVPQLIWFILILGSALLMVFSFFLHSDSELLKRIYLSFLSALIAMSLFLVFMLDHPFVGSTQVSKEGYEHLISHIHQLKKQ